MKKRLLILYMAAAISLFSGCAFKSGDDLLVAPKPTKNYVALQKELDDILQTGAIYASPESGQNRSTVKLVDLDNDGTEEVVSFFRESAMGNKFSVYVHKKIGDEYIQMGVITGTGSAIESVEYPVITPEGKRGIVIAWQRYGEVTNVLSVSAFEGVQISTVLETEYSAYSLTDLTGDGANDLITMRVDGLGKNVASLYSYNGTGMAELGETALSSDALTIVRITSGLTTGYQPAIFIEERGETGSGLMTDIIVYDDTGLRNIALPDEQSETNSTFRPVSVYSADINDDRIIEVPQAVLAPGYERGAADVQYFLDWYAYSATGQEKKTTTYHNQQEEWQLYIPERWQEQITVSRSRSGTNISATVFELYNEWGDNIPLLHIYCLTGDLREYYATTNGMVRLDQSNTAIYTYMIPAEGQDLEIAPLEGEIENWFKRISQDWSR